ncbi:hypothetical protein C8A00DRAFT_17989 [Chaetomidium leptoderma]|uniref:BTB domain-containing protein n=1 Tax=Chaetomidium leptoderma TaxID=669021 RepID=A0AAN6VFF3_9PEZI|nr:hypothetical protein C8A00DRAFT_17989 [Chaetomidium leptoderma]
MCDHTMDPSGDTIFTLNDPNDLFAVLHDDLIPATEETASSFPAIEAVEQASAEEGKEEGKKDNAAPNSITFRVSSHHLILASPIFKAALTGGWKEGDTSTGELQYSTNGWDTEAMTIVLNALHGHYLRVPMTVTLEMLAKIATIVDYYAVHEAMQLLRMFWIDHLSKALLITTCSKRDSALWICVSCVFGDAGIFMHVTQVAIQYGQGDISSLGLPIPPAVVDRVNKQRRDLVDTISAGLHDLKQGFIDGREGCNIPCRTMQLGALIQGMNDVKLLDHLPGNHFEDFSLSKLVRGVGAIKCPIWCDHDSGRHEVHQCAEAATSPRDRPGYNIARKTEISSLLKHTSALTSRVKGMMGGLQLADFVSSSSESK